MEAPQYFHIATDKNWQAVVCQNGLKLKVLLIVKPIEQDILL